MTEGDILGPSEAMRAAMDYFSHSADTRALLGKLAATRPKTLACMHGSAWSGDGRRLLLDLADALAPVAVARCAPWAIYHLAAAPREPYIGA